DRAGRRRNRSSSSASPSGRIGPTRTPRIDVEPGEAKRRLPGSRGSAGPWGRIHLFVGFSLGLVGEHRVAVVLAERLAVLLLAEPVEPAEPARRLGLEYDLVLGEQAPQVAEQLEPREDEEEPMW